MKTYSFIMFLAAVAFALIGIYCEKSPEKVIELQKKFYAKINWRLEPISMEKELKNTRVMGRILVVLATLLFILR